ncbi:hypothetical protein ACFUOZ_10010 [Paenarthrobacter sp. NPDC057355]|uniref:hypothetical protein n=1 Tax=Paenarthrobacter sp. NPDC057355 TaxID=3346105 RepID=UPI00363131D8
MNVEASVWAEVLTAAVAWLTVVFLLLTRVPKPPSLLDAPPVLETPPDAPVEVGQPEDRER